MFSGFAITARVISFLEGGISRRSIAWGVCLAMFLGFVPLAGPMTILLTIVFFIFKFNRISTIITLPLFKVLYLSGIYRVTEALGSYLLIKAGVLTNFWEWFLGLPVIALLDINNTLVAGGFAFSFLLCAPVYWLSKRAAGYLQARYAKKIAGSRFGKWVNRCKLPLQVIGRAQQVKNIADK
ncbi:MAG: DUF2062 domain-containing protein [Candidatus Omnitrophota bacterium]|nr:DUF2062 domain-containing protein [Candidatus Omnitrophota bacterium]